MTKTVTLLTIALLLSACVEPRARKTQQQKQYAVCFRFRADTAKAYCSNQPVNLEMAQEIIKVNQPLFPDVIWSFEAQAEISPSPSPSPSKVAKNRRQPKVLNESCAALARLRVMEYKEKANVQ